MNESTYPVIPNLGSLSGDDNAQQSKSPCINEIIEKIISQSPMNEELEKSNNEVMINIVDQYPYIEINRRNRVS